MQKCHFYFISIFLMTQDGTTETDAHWSEVDRAADNLMKSGKMFGAAAVGGPGGSRRDSMPPMAGRGYTEFGKAAFTPDGLPKRGRIHHWTCD